MSKVNFNIEMPVRPVCYLPKILCLRGDPYHILRGATCIHPLQKTNSPNIQGYSQLNLGSSFIKRMDSSAMCLNITTHSPF